jgi:hypothetical protein
MSTADSPRPRRRAARAVGLGLTAAAFVAFVIYSVGDSVVFLVTALAVASFGIHVLLGLGIVRIAGGICWRLLPASFRSRHADRRLRFFVTVGLCLLAFAFVGLQLNHRWLPSRFHPASIVVDLMLFGAVVLAGAFLFRPSLRRAAAMGAGAGAVTLAVAAIGAVSSGSGATPGSSAGALATLPYLTWVPTGDTADTSGVVHHDVNQACPGLNLYSPRNLPAARLVDMQGEVLHEWRAPVYDADNWGHIELLPDNGLLAIARQHLLLRVDFDSRIRWVRPIRAHHDIAVVDSIIYVLGKRGRMVSIRGIPTPILDDSIIRVSMDGRVIDETWMFDLLHDAITPRQAARIYRWLLEPETIRSILKFRREEGFLLDGSSPPDVFHTNALEVIETDAGPFRRGNILLCTRELDRVWVVDVERKQVVWSWGEGQVQWPHHPTLLENGNVLLFDNGSHRGYSRVVEVDPRDGRIAWQYTADNPGTFFSFTRGGVQRLPNGNTLITNSDSGHAFEVTPNGEIVWEFLNPEMREDRSTRAAIYRMTRIVDPARMENLREASLR